MIELLIVIVILLVLTSMAYPPIAQSVAGTRTDNAARIVAADLRYALALAARKGTPVVVQFDATDLELRVVDRPTGEVLHRRTFGRDSEFPIASAATSASTVQVFPNGSTSGQVVITVTTPVRSNQIVMSRAGLVRIRRQ
jgi:Tfp pilus assembly protein FimT